MIPSETVLNVAIPLANVYCFDCLHIICVEEIIELLKLIHGTQMIKLNDLRRSHGKEPMFEAVKVADPWFAESARIDIRDRVGDN